MIIAERIVINEELKAYIHSNSNKRIKHENDVMDFAYDDFDKVNEYDEIDEPTAEEIVSILTGDTE